MEPMLQKSTLANLFPPSPQQERFANVLGRDAAAHKPSLQQTEEDYLYTTPRVPNVA